MFSCASPENDARMRERAVDALEASRFRSVPASNGAWIISTRSVSARQASGEKRSRITEAADCAAPTRNGSAPVEIALLQHRRRDQRRPGRSECRSGTASQCAEQAPDVGVDAALESVCSRSRG